MRAYCPQFMRHILCAIVDWGVKARARGVFARGLETGVQTFATTLQAHRERHTHALELLSVAERSARVFALELPDTTKT